MRRLSRIRQSIIILKRALKGTGIPSNGLRTRLRGTDEFLFLFLSGKSEMFSKKKKKRKISSQRIFFDCETTPISARRIHKAGIGISYTPVISFFTLVFVTLPQRRDYDELISLTVCR